MPHRTNRNPNAPKRTPLSATQVREQMDRHGLYRGLHTMLKLHDIDAVRLMSAGGMPVSKSAAQDMLRRFNPETPRKSRRVCEEHILALIEGILLEAGTNTLPIEPKEIILEILGEVRLAIKSGEKWPYTGETLASCLQTLIAAHRNPEIFQEQTH